MAEVTETLLMQKLESSWNRKDAVENFKEDKELTVEITLSEYRRLVGIEATTKYKIDEAEKDKYERNSENTKLKERVKQLENTIFEYRKKFGDLETESEE